MNEDMTAAVTAKPAVSLILASSTGGVGVHVLSLARELAAAGWRVSVCAPSSTLDIFDFAATGAAVVPVPIGRPDSYLAVAAYLREVSAGADILHAHGLRAGTVAALSNRSRARPLVVTWHNAVLAQGPVSRVLHAAGERYVARAATVTLAASADLAARVRALGGHDVRAGLVAAPWPHPRHGRDDVRTRLGIAPDRLLAVCVGRLHPQKDHAVLIAAAAAWRRSGIPVDVVIAGDGPLRAALQQQIDATNAPVRLLGRRDDVADLLAAADLAVLPSRWEARALAAQEALVLGVPLLATEVGGMTELVGQAAVLVGPGDLDAFTTAGADLLTDPARRAGLSAAGQEQAARWPNEHDTARAVAAVYRELLG